MKKMFMYVPIAVYKNNAILIDSMDTFALYFCSSVKQRMRPAIPEASEFDADGLPREPESDDEFGSSGYSPEDSVGDAPLDDDDDL